MQTIIGRQFVEIVVPIIEKARSSIKIVVFDWRWYPQDVGASCQLFNQAIVRAVRRGVQICVVANNDEIVKILNSVGISARKLITHRLVHCKLMVIDSEILITGSHNYTQSAFNLNYEFSIVLYDVEAALVATNFFTNLFNS